MELYPIHKDYEIIEKLGQGSFGSAFKAKNKKDNKIYVIKQIMLKEDFKKEEIEKIKREAKILFDINNENIVKCYDSFFTQKSYNIILEYCKGLDLRKFIDNQKSKKKLIEENLIFSFIFDLINGLKEIHERNLIHRDLKPENLFLTSNNRIKIGDFGISKQLSTKSYASSKVGTYNYCAPEIINGQKYNNKVDIWSLGCIIYELCTLECCFESEFVLGLCNKIINERHGKINNIFYKPELQNFIDLLLKKDYKERPDIKSIFVYATKNFSSNNNLNLQKNLYIDNKNKSFLSIDPFKILGINENEFIIIEQNNKINQKDFLINKYWELKNTDDNKNKKLFLSYYILYNKNKFNRNGDNFIITKKDPFYYVIMNDLNNLKMLYKQNKYILCQKDNYKRTLLHLSVLGEYYEITKFLLEKGINFDEPDSFLVTALYYAKGKIEELLKSFGASIKFYNDNPPGCNTNGININIKDINKIDLIYNSFIESKIINKVQIIKNNEEKVGIRFYRTKFPKGEFYKNPTKDWIPVYHGTKFVSMEHILLYGLHCYGEPLYGHIRLGEKVNNVENWANSLFVTPSIFYASKYAETIKSENEDWYIIIEAFVDLQNFDKYKSTIYNYIFKNGEPKILEYRHNGCGRFPPIMHIHCSLDINGIDTTSLLFVKKRYLDNATNYSEGKIYENKI